MMEMIYETRTQRLAQLIQERFGGSQAGFAAAVGLGQPSVNQRLYHTLPHATSIGPRRSIGERMARSIEQKLGLSQYWLDGLDLGRRKKPRAPVPSTGPFDKAQDRLRTGSRAAAPASAGGTPNTQNKSSTERRTNSRRKPEPERRVNGDRRQADLNEAA